jgi:tRNA dimethylallyltransferase
MGPTASGKTDLAVRLRQRFPVELISVDSAQVYRGMDIGTAKPEPEVLRAAPHALIDIRDPDEAYSAAQFRSDALEEMARIRERGAIPLLVGGTMLYFRALIRGLSRLPQADPAVRERLESEAAKRGWPALHRELAAVDPEAAGRIHANDAQRIQRALEVWEITGQPLSELHGGRPDGRPDAREDDFGWRALKIVVCPAERSVLHERIERRFGIMLEQGLVDELRSLRERYSLSADMPSMRCVGYRQAWAYLERRIDAGELTATAVAATRQLAKRQLTWLRRETGALWYDLRTDGAATAIECKTAEFLDFP